MSQRRIRVSKQVKGYPHPNALKNDTQRKQFWKAGEYEGFLTTGTLLNVFFPRWPARPIVRSARLGLRAACVQVDVCRHRRPHLPHRASQHWQTDDRLQVALRLS